MSSVTVWVTPTKKQTVGVTPSMVLREVLKVVCEKHDLSPGEHCLRLGKATLDLSLPIRFANLPPNAKLELATKDAGATSVVSLAVDVEGLPRWTCPFVTNTCLWSVLKEHENQNSSNLTRRCENEMYVQPVVFYLHTKYGNLSELFSLTLSNIGLDSGNGLLRISFQKTELPFASIDFTALQSQLCPSFTPNMEKASIDLLAQSQTASHLPLRQVPASSKETTMPTTSSLISREPRVYMPPSSNAPLTIDLPDSFYDLTEQDAQILLSSARKEIQSLENRTMKTKSMRDKEATDRLTRHPKTLLRFRFPDYIQLQGVFLSSETIQNAYHFVREHLRQDYLEESFILYSSPPRQEAHETAGKTLFQLNWTPATVVYVAFRNTQLKGPYLNEASLALKEPFPINKDTESTDNKKISGNSTVDHVTTTAAETSTRSSVREDTHKDSTHGSDKKTLDDKLKKFLKLKK